MRDNRKENPMEEQEKLRTSDLKSKSTIKYVRYLLLLIMVMVALILLFANRDQITGDNFRRLMAKINVGFFTVSSENGEVHFDTVGTGETVVYKDGFANATVEKLVITDKNGAEFQNTPLGFRAPCLSKNNKYVLVYDSGGTGIMVADSFSVLFEVNMENNIVTAKMTDSGGLIVVTEGEGYLSKVFVYDSSFKEVYRYNSLNRYILDAALAEDQKSMAVSALNTEGADVSAEILYFKLDKEAVQWSATFDQSPCIAVDIKDGGSICGLFSWGMVSLNKKGTEQGRYELDNQVLQCYSMKNGDVNVFAVSAAENGNTVLVLCNEKAKVTETIELDYYAVQLDYYGGRTAVLGNRRAGVYNSNGKLLWEDTPDRAIGISLMGKEAVVVIGETSCVYNAI